MLYFFMLIIFLCLIIGPIVASRFIKTLPKIPLDLMQPTGQNNNDTKSITTGRLLNGKGGAATGTLGDDSGAATSSGAAASSTSGSDAKFRYF